jgi:hypothetical protein
MSRGTGPLAWAAILAVGLSGAACTSRDDRAAANRDTETGALSASPSPSPYGSTVASDADRDAITAGELAANPEKYVGQRVTVRGDVADIMGTNSFTLDEDRLTADKNLLVLSRNGVPSQQHKDEKVTVAGRVQMFNSTEIERDNDWFDATPEVETKYQNRPVLIADSIRTADGRELTMGGALPAGPGDPGHGNRPADAPRP